MMKRKAKIILLAALTLTFGTLAVACKGEGEVSTPDEPKLLPPEISAQDGGIYWTSAKNATSYKICLNNGEWQNVSAEEKTVAYPTLEGDYTLQVVSVATGYKDSDPVQFTFKVDALTIADCTQVDNVLIFTGKNVLCSVNDGEYAELPESQLLDFSAAEVGSSFTVKYYEKGGYWEESNSTYYIDSEIKNASLTVTQALSAPVLETDTANKGIVWTAVPNAVSYQVIVDGATTTVNSTDNLFVAFPQSIGEHTITVKALENGSYTQSAESVFVMETKEFGTPLVTYNAEEQKIVWDAKYADYMLFSDGGEYANVNGAQIAYTTNLKLKLASHFEATENIFYLESKTLSFQQRTVPTISFNSSGDIYWNEDDEGKAKDYYYSVGLEEDEDSFARTTVNRLDVSKYEPGAYKLKVYASGYLEEGVNDSVLWLDSANSEIFFSVLAAPLLDYKTNTLLWEIDEKATAYQCKIGDSDEWITATKDGEFEATEFTTYYVKAIGNETANNYVVNSGISELFFDPTLKEGELAKFDDEKYLLNVGASLEGNSTNSGKTSIVTAGANETETSILAGSEDGKVLKLTAGNAAPRVDAEWGNSDGFSFNFFAGVNIGSYVLVVRMYMTSNPDRANGKDGSGPANVEGLFNYLLKGKTQSLYGWSKQIAVDQWVDYVISVPANWSERVQSLSINFHDNGKEGDAIYVDYIKLVDTRTTEKTINFADYTSVPVFVSSNREMLISEGHLTNKTTLWNNESMVISYKELALKPGDAITITATTVGNGMNIDINGTYYKWVSANSTATVTIEITEVMTLNTIAFRCSSAGGATYKIASVVIGEAPKENLAPLNLDFSAYTEVPSFVTSDKEVNIIDGTLVNDYYRLYSGEKMVIRYSDIQLKAGDTITVKLRLIAGNLNFDINGVFKNYYSTNKDDGMNFEGGDPIEWIYTVEEDMVLETIALRSTNPTTGSRYVVSSIVINKA